MSLRPGPATGPGSPDAPGDANEAASGSLALVGGTFNGMVIEQMTKDQLYQQYQILMMQEDVIKEELKRRRRRPPPAMHVSAPEPRGPGGESSWPAQRPTKDAQSPPLLTPAISKTRRRSYPRLATGILKSWFLGA